MSNLLTLLSTRETYKQYKKAIPPSTDEEGTIIAAMEDYYLHENHIDWNEFSEWFLIKNTMFSQEKKTLYKTLFTALANKPPLTETMTKLLSEELIVRSLYVEMANHTNQVAGGQGRGNIEQLKEIIEKAEVRLGVTESIEDWLVLDTEEELAKEVVTGINWRMGFLNAGIGHLYKGKFGMICMRPNAGKTSFLCSEATYMGQQIKEDEYVIWFCNEESGTDVRRRLWEAALQKPLDTFSPTLEEERDAYIKLLGHRHKILVVDSSKMGRGGMTKQKCEIVLSKYKAGLIIFDQLRNVQGFKEEGPDKLGAMYVWARELSKKYAPLLTVHQAGGEAEGQLDIKMSHAYGSKTDLQGALDFFIGIGVNEPNLTRRVTICKKKRATGPMVDKSIVAGTYTEVILDYDRCIYVENTGDYDSCAYIENIGDFY